MRLVLLVITFTLLTSPLLAAVDIAPRGKRPVRLEDVYQQSGVPYIAIEDAIGAVGLKGHWNSVKHTFRIRTKRGWAEISPASRYLKLNTEYYPLKDKPRFIDGRLRVTDSFVLNQLPLLVGKQIYFRNLDPHTDTLTKDESGPIDQLFAFLLNRKQVQSGPLIRAVAIDPGHGGLETGAIAASGYKEKQVNLAVAEKLAKQLKMKLGIPIYLSRDGDYELTVKQRLEPASRENVDLWLLLHVQSAFSAVPKGVSLLIRPEAAEQQSGEPENRRAGESGSLQLANQLALALRTAGVEVNGIYASPLMSLGRGDLPTVQVELGYLSHPEELAMLANKKYQDRLAQALYQGVRRFAELKKESNQ